MVSPLWKACQEGDAARVDEILADASSIDVEIKDHTGVTPLIQAIRGGHVEIVKALIAHGADPTNASAQGRPETYTTDPLILHILATARGDIMPYPEHLVEHLPLQQQHPQQQQFYPYPPYGYPQYPLQEGWYAAPQPPPQGQPSPQEGDPVAANLPPPEVSKNIPCRYFPSCRYGTSCAFLHPQPSYFTGPLPPPAQYSAYYTTHPSHHQHPPPPPPPPPAAIPPPFSPPAAAQGGHGHMHSHSHSEIMSSMSPPAPPPLPMMGYMPMSPTAYQGYPLPPPPPPPPAAVPVDENGAPLSPYGANGGASSLLGPGPYSTAYGPVGGGGYANGAAPGHHHGHNGGGGRARRGSATFRDREGRSPNGNGGGGGYGGGGGKKPACLFFPSGRCRNGDECRFPHIMGDPNSPPPSHGHAGRSHFHSRRGGYNGNGNGGSSTGLEDRMAGMRIGGHGGRNNYKGTTQQQAEKAQPEQQQQRIPSADDFPVLNGRGSTNGSDNGVNGSHGHENRKGTTENSHVNGHATNASDANGGGSLVSGHGQHHHPPSAHTHHQNGWANAMNGTGPTAAQILREGSRGTSPVPKPVPPKVQKPGEQQQQQQHVVTKTASATTTTTTNTPISAKNNIKPMEVKAAA